MPYILPGKLQNLVPYDPIEGDFLIRLDANESFLPLCDEERRSLEAALAQANLRRYPDHAAKKLCQAAAAYYGTKASLITAFNGSDEALSLLSTAFLGQGKKLCCYALDFSMYRFYAELTGAQCIQLAKTPSFSICADAAIEAIEQHKPEMFVFSNPCSPTSLVLSVEDVRRMVLAAQQSNTLFVLDEAYMDFSDQSLIDEVEAHPNLIILRTCSKAVGLAGLRLGFAIANEALTRVMHAAKSPYNVGVLTQEVGTAMLCQPERLQAGIAEIRQSCDELSAGLRALGLNVVGGAANFVFVEAAGQYFEPLKARGIIVRRIGEHLRITVGTPEENSALLKALEEILT